MTIYDALLARVRGVGPFEEQYTDRIGAPAAGAVVEATDGVRRLRAPVNEFGRAVMDGLREGQYTLTVYAAGYPAVKRVVAGPRKVDVAARGCAVEVLVAGGAK